MDHHYEIYPSIISPKKTKVKRYTPIFSEKDTKLPSNVKKNVSMKKSAINSRIRRQKDKQLKMEQIKKIKELEAENAELKYFQNQNAETELQKQIKKLQNKNRMLIQEKQHDREQHLMIYVNEISRLLNETEKLIKENAELKEMNEQLELEILISNN